MTRQRRGWAMTTVRKGVPHRKYLNKRTTMRAIRRVLKYFEVTRADR
jgi:hypothetical protein